MKKTLSKIAFEYARNYIELEAGRDQYIKERSAILRSLKKLVDDEIKEANLKVRYESRDSDIVNRGHVWIDIKNSIFYRKNKKSTGVGFMLSDYKEDDWPFSFYFYVYFKTGKNTNISKVAIKKLIEYKYNDFRVAEEQGGWWDLVLDIPLRSKKFNIDEFKKIVKKLPYLYKKCDRIVAKYCE